MLDQTSTKLCMSVASEQAVGICSDEVLSQQVESSTRNNFFANYYMPNRSLRTFLDKRYSRGLTASIRSTAPFNYSG